MIQIFPLPLLRSIGSPNLRIFALCLVLGGLGCVVRRQLGVKNGEGLGIVELVSLLIVEANSQEINALVVQVDVSEGLEMDQNFSNRSKRHLFIKLINNYLIYRYKN